MKSSSASSSARRASAALPATANNNEKGHISHGKKRSHPPKTFLKKLRFVLLILALTVGAALFYMLQIAHTSSLADTSHIYLSLLDSRQTLIKSPRGTANVLQATGTDAKNADPLSDGETKQLLRQPAQQGQQADGRSGSRLQNEDPKPRAVLKFDKYDEAQKSDPKEAKHSLTAVERDAQYLERDDSHNHIKEQNRPQEAAAHDSIDESLVSLAEQARRGAAVAMTAGDSYQLSNMDGASPTNVKAVEAALALDQFERDENAKESGEKDKLHSIETGTKALRQQWTENLKQRDRLREIYLDAVVKLTDPELRREIDPLYVEGIDTPIHDLYRVPFEPKVPYLGVLVDAGRHYFPISWWKQLIVYLYKLRFNLIQFRLTDDQTFNVQLESYPQLATPVMLDYNKERRVYTPRELRDLVAFAKKYNISLVPEINVPGHAGAWAGIPDLVVMCPEFICNAGYGLPLNVDHPELKNILRGVLQEILEIFDDPPFLHLGGDEVNMADPCFVEVRRKPFHYTNFENDLKDILEELGYDLDRVVRWERTGQSLDLDRAGSVEQFWQNLPGIETPLAKYPDGKFKPWIISRGLYFDTNHEDDALAIFRYAQGSLRMRGIPSPTAIIAGTFELGAEFWLHRNVATRLIATAMGASDTVYKSSEFSETFNNTCRDLRIDGRWCNLQGNIAVLLEEYQEEHEQTWQHWKAGICDRLTDSELLLTLKKYEPTRKMAEQAAYNIFWDSFGEDLPPQPAERRQTYNGTFRADVSVPARGVIFDMVSSITSPPSRVLELLRNFVAPLGFNLLQLRLVDDHGFAIRLKSQPKLGYSAVVQPSEIPEADDYKVLATSASQELGIQIMPEISLSTNAGGWISSGYPADCPHALCEKRGIANDISLPGLLPVIYSVVRELRQIFSSPYLHLGHDDRQAALEGCLREGGNKEEHLSQFEEKLTALVGILDIPQDKILRWENQESKVYKDRTGHITHYRARNLADDLHELAKEDVFFVTVDLLGQTPWSIYQNTQGLVKLKPRGILGEIGNIGEEAWESRNIGLKLAAFAMGLQQKSPGEDLSDEHTFYRALAEVCKGSAISGCNFKDESQKNTVHKIDMSWHKHKMCQEFTYKIPGRVVKKEFLSVIS